MSIYSVDVVSKSQLDIRYPLSGSMKDISTQKIFCFIEWEPFSCHTCGFLRFSWFSITIHHRFHVCPSIAKCEVKRRKRKSVHNQIFSLNNLKRKKLKKGRTKCFMKCENIEFYRGKVIFQLPDFSLLGKRTFYFKTFRSRFDVFFSFFIFLLNLMHVLTHQGKPKFSKAL